MFKRILLISVLGSIYTSSFALSPQMLDTLNNNNIAQSMAIINKYNLIIKQSPDNIDALKVLGIAYHNLAVLGDKNAAQKAFDYLQQASQLASQKDPEIMAYWGSAETLIARDLGNPIQKMMRANAGIAKIDKAVAMGNNNIFVRMVRIENSQSLPSFLGRQKYVERDTDFLIDQYDKNPKAFSAFEAAFVYYQAGNLAADQKDLRAATTNYQATIKLAPNSKYADFARNKL